MANTSTDEVNSECELTADGESDSEDEAEVIASLSCFELETCLSKMMRKYQLLLSKHKTLKKTFVVTSENFTKSERNSSDLN